ncbi:anti-virulence regulator CigR family protein [Elongatibacter sediminis]|uniref:Anti-virulence regulator CigR family protein n=1 Tax=Elongatibacter sediminis TaxID=3119006 RepID=A0AAW9RKP8_9GAMM
MIGSHTLSTAVVVTALALFSTSLAAEPPAGKGRKPAETDAHAFVSISAGITLGDARQLAEAHGLTGAKPLPPGIRKNLARGKPLPPGIARTRVPDAFVAELPRHEGYEWRRSGIDLVLVAHGSLVISDILEGVFD